MTASACASLSVRSRPGRMPNASVSFRKRQPERAWSSRLDSMGSVTSTVVLNQSLGSGCKELSSSCQGLRYQIPRKASCNFLDPGHTKQRRKRPPKTPQRVRARREDPSPSRREVAGEKKRKSKRRRAEYRQRQSLDGGVGRSDEFELVVGSSFKQDSRPRLFQLTFNAPGASSRLGASDQENSASSFERKWSSCDLLPATFRCGLQPDVVERIAGYRIGTEQWPARPDSVAVRSGWWHPSTFLCRHGIA